MMAFTLMLIRNYMIALLTNPPVPLALRVDLLEFRKSKPSSSSPALIFKLHKIIANHESRAEEVKIAKRALMGAIGRSNQFSQAGATYPPAYTEWRQNLRRPLEATTSRRTYLPKPQEML